VKFWQKQWSPLKNKHTNGRRIVYLYLALPVPVEDFL